MDEVYAFASDPMNLPRWATGLGGGIEPQDDHWLIPSPQGQAILRFAPRNEWGVLDHQVTLPDGTKVDVPMRVVANGEGCLLIFTLFHLPSMDQQTFENDTALVRKDLAALKQLLESHA